MAGWNARVFGLLLLGLGLAAATEPARACWNCSISGCVSDPVGFYYCRVVIVFGQPTCIASGLCPPIYPWGTGGASDDFPKPRRPLFRPEQAAEADPGELTVFGFTLPCARGCRVFEPGQTSRLLRGVAPAGDAGAMLGALLRTMADRGPHPRFETAEVSVGPGEYRGAFAGGDGNGYGIRAARSSGGVAVKLCAIEARMPGRGLAAETLGPDDLLLVRVWLEDQEYLVAFSVVAAGLAGEPTTDSAAGIRRAFVEQARLLTGRSRHRPIRLEALDPDVSGCP